jgi:hypothetical protein
MPDQQRLQERKPVVVTGDLNVAHMPIDIHSPKTNLRSAGFTQVQWGLNGNIACGFWSSGQGGVVRKSQNMMLHVKYSAFIAALMLACMLCAAKAWARITAS